MPNNDDNPKVLKRLAKKKRGLEAKRDGLLEEEAKKEAQAVLAPQSMDDVEWYFGRKIDVFAIRSQSPIQPNHFSMLSEHGFELVSVVTDNVAAQMQWGNVQRGGGAHLVGTTQDIPYIYYFQRKRPRWWRHQIQKRVALFLVWRGKKNEPPEGLAPAVDPEQPASPILH